MSTTDQETREPGGPILSESKSSIKITRTAKGDPTFEVKVYEDTPADELDRLQKLAADHYKALVAEFFGERSAA